MAAKTQTKAEAARQDREDAREHLRRLFTPESVINVNTVQTAGTSRRVQVYAVVEGGRIQDVSIVVARAIGERFIDPASGAPSGLVVRGGGFDAGHDVAYRLRAALWFDDERGDFVRALTGLQHNRV